MSTFLHAGALGGSHPRVIQRPVYYPPFSSAVSLERQPASFYFIERVQVNTRQGLGIDMFPVILFFNLMYSFFMVNNIIEHGIFSLTLDAVVRGIYPLLLRGDGVQWNFLRSCVLARCRFGRPIP